MDVKTMHVIYARVSTEEQAKTGYGINSQLEACRSKFSEMGLFVGKEYIDDGYSGEFIDRPEMDKLRNDLYSGLVGKNDYICVYDPDRLARNLTHILLIADDIERAGAKLTFVTGDYDVSPEGKLFFSIRGAIAAFEKAKIRERTTRGKRTKAMEGKIVQNSQPYGFDWDIEKSLYTINEPEGEVVALIYSLCVNNKLGIYRITDELRKRNLLNKENKPFSASHINDILKKPMYCGEYHQFYLSCKQIGQRKVKTTKAPLEKHVLIDIPPIVSREIWEQAQQQLAVNQSISKRNTQHNYLLQGILYCPLCNRKLTATVCHGKRKNSDDVLYFYYFCISESNANYKRQRCGNRRIQADYLDSQVWDTLKLIASGQTDISNYIKNDNSKDYSNEILQMNTQKEALLQRKIGIVQWFKDGMIDNPTATKQINDLNKEIANIDLSLSHLSIIHNKNKPAEIPINDILQATTFEQKRSIMLQFSYKIFVVKTEDQFEFWFER